MQKIRCLDFVGFLHVFTVSKHLHSYSELHLTAFCVLLCISHSCTSDCKIHKWTCYFSVVESKTNKSFYTNLPKKSALKFRAVFPLANGLSVFQQSFQVHQTVCSNPSSLWLLLMCFALVLNFVYLLLWVLHSIEMTADSEGNGDFFFPGQ